MKEAALGLLFFLFVTFIRANNILVTSASNSGTGSLREAVSSAIDGDVILFSSTLNGTAISLSSEITISKSISIIGNGANNTILDGGSGYFDLIKIQQGVVCFVSKLTLERAMNGLTVYGKLFLHKSEIRSINYFGIMAQGDTVKIKDCYIHNAGMDGIHASNATPTIVLNSTITNNMQNGIYRNVEGSFIIEGCTVFGNGTGINTITLPSANEMIISNNTISGNTQGGLKIDNGQGANDPSNTKLYNNIIFGNTSSDIQVISSTGSIPLQSKNIIGVTLSSLSSISWFSVNSPLLDAAGPKMNGGLWPTVQITSSASEAINNADLAFAKEFDGRGFKRNGQPDIGAFEFNGIACDPLEIFNQNSSIVYACKGAGVNLNAIVSYESLPVFKWEVNTGNGFAPLNDGTNYSGTSTSNLIISGITSSMFNNQYRCKISNSCMEIYSSIQTLKEKTLDANYYKQDITCYGGNNGSISIIPVNSTYTYSYNWSVAGQTSSTINNLSAGSYTCIVNESNGCSYQQIFTVNQGPQLNMSPVIKHLNCGETNTGEIDVNILNQGQYTYNWQPGSETTAKISGLSAGSYTCTILYNGSCSENKVFTVNASNINLNLMVTNASCYGANDGSASVVTSGGITPYTYSWTSITSTSNTISALAPGSYTCTVTDANNCTNGQAFQITAPPMMGVNAGSDKTICKGSSASLTGTISATGLSGLTYSWSPNINISSSNTASTTVNPTTTTVYEFRVKDANGCIESDMVTVTVNPLPVVTTPAAVSICKEKSTTLNVTIPNGNTILWTPATNLSSAISATTLASPQSTTMYKFAVKDNNACIYYDSVKVTVNPLPVISAGAAATICSGKSVLISASAPSGSTITWSPASGLNSTHAANPTATPTATTTYTMSVSNSNGCVSIDSVKINVNVSPTITVGQAVSLCAGKSTTLYSTISNGASIDWAPATGLSSTVIANPIANPTTTTNYVATVSSQNGCKVKDSVKVTVNALPSVSVGASVTYCPGQTKVIPASAPAGATILWAPANGLSSNSLLNPSVNITTNTTYTITVTDANGCVKKDSTKTIIKALPVITAGNDVYVCTGSTKSILATVPSGTAIAWLPTTGLSSATVANPVLGATAAAQYTLTVTATNGCKSTDTVNVFQTTLPQVNLAAIDALCYGGMGKATATVTGNGNVFNYQWTPGSATSSSISAPSGTYTCVVTDGNGCSNSNTVSISQPGKIGIYGNASNCPTSGGNNCNGRMYYNGHGGTGNKTLLFKFGNDTILNPYSNLCPGIYTIKATDANGCSETISESVPMPPQLNINIAVTNNDCYRGRDGALTAIISGAPSGSHFYYRWTNYSNNFYQSGSSISRLEAGTYNLEIKDITGGCTYQKTATITSPPQFKINFTTIATTCGLANGSVTTAATGGTPPYNFYWTNGSSATAINNLNAGFYMLRVSDSKQCFYSESVYLQNSNGPAITLNQVTNVSCKGKSNGAVDVNLSGGTPPYNILWSNGATSQDIVNVPAAAYNIVVKDMNGCKASLISNVLEPDSIKIDKGSTATLMCGAANGTAIATVMGGTAPYLYRWDANAGNQTNSTANNLKAGYYHVNITDANGCNDSAVVVVSDPNAPLISLDSSKDAGCLVGGLGVGKICISVSGGGAPFTYLWSNGATTEDISTLGRGNFSVLVTDQAGCKSSFNKFIDGQTPGTAQICLVTVDTSNNHTIIYWEKNVPGVAEYKIYRETSVQDQYALLATIPASDFSKFEDTLADADAKPWKYKILVTDSCDKRSEFSVQHKSMHLAILLASGVSNLSWDQYEGFNFNKYYIFRKNSYTGWHLIDSTANNVTNYTDNNPPPSLTDLEYMIEVKPILPCNPSRGSINTSRSNIKTARVQTVGVAAIKSTEHQFNLYPNPATEEINIGVKNEARFSLHLYDAQGRFIKAISAKTMAKFPVSDLAAGVYFVAIQFEDGYINRTKFVKQ